MVRLVEQTEYNSNDQCQYFNSYMVRLVDSSTFDATSKELFQFLHGAIGGLIIKKNRNYFIRFQFLHGAIGGKLTFKNMNNLNKFQFLHGAIGGRVIQVGNKKFSKISIPTWCDWWSNNFKNPNASQHISIPTWCDWW